jgi:hypothetical protein
MALDCPLAAPEYAAAAAAFAGSDPAQTRGWQARLGLDPDGLAGPVSFAVLEANRPDDAPDPEVAFNGNRQNSATRYSISRHGSDFRLGDHFTLVEFASRDGADEVLNHPALVALLTRVREHFDAPVTINSGYRSKAHNKRIGGASKSRHVMGLAADVAVWHHTPHEVADFVETLNPGGLGRYNTFTHVDVEGRNRRWDNR